MGKTGRHFANSSGGTRRIMSIPYNQRPPGTYLELNKWGLMLVEDRENMFHMRNGRTFL